MGWTFLTTVCLRMPLVALLLTLLSACVLLSCTTPPPVPQERRIDALALQVGPEENRPVSYTDKASAYYYTRTHDNALDERYAYFQGWNVARNRVFQDYTLFVEDTALDRTTASVTVAPHALQRTYTRATETLRLYDDQLVLGVEVDGVQGATVRLQLTSDQTMPLLEADTSIALFGVDIPSGHVLGIGPVQDAPLDLLPGAVPDVSSPVAGGGFFIVLAPDPESARALLADARERHTRWLATREARMESLVTEAISLQPSDARWAQALHWNALTLDQLIMDQTGTGIYAGLPWFNDYWGRDLFITLPGAALVTGQFDVARDILRSFASYQNTDPESRLYGRMPNRLRPDDIIYNTTDGTPRFVIALHEYLRYTGDTALAEELYPVVQRSIDGALAHWVDDRGYLTHDDADTWMDAKENGERPFSPRGTRANDVQALWYDQLRYGAIIADQVGDETSARQWRTLADVLKRHLQEDFLTPDLDYMADHLNADGTVDQALRPNQLFALHLLPDTLQAPIARTVWEALVYPWGVASLHQEDPDFHPYHEYPAFYHKDAAYHNGTVWLWLNGIAMQRMLEAEQVDSAWALFAHMTDRVLDDSGVGSLAENMDALPRPDTSWAAQTGTFLQAWSNAEYQRVWYQWFLGVRPNALDNHLTLAPRIPETIDELSYTVQLSDGVLHGRYTRDEELRTYSYVLENTAPNVELDLPPFILPAQSLAADGTLEITVQNDTLRLRSLRADGTVASDETYTPNSGRMDRLTALDALFEDTDFAEPSLRSDLQALQRN